MNRGRLRLPTWVHTYIIYNLQLFKQDLNFFSGMENPEKLGQLIEIADREENHLRAHIRHRHGLCFRRNRKRGCVRLCHSQSCYI